MHGGAHVSSQRLRRGCGSIEHRVRHSLWTPHVIYFWPPARFELEVVCVTVWLCAQRGNDHLSGLPAFIPLVIILAPVLRRLTRVSAPALCSTRDGKRAAEPGSAAHLCTSTQSNLKVVHGIRDALPERAVHGPVRACGPEKFIKCMARGFVRC